MWTCPFQHRVKGLESLCVINRPQLAFHAPTRSSNICSGSSLENAETMALVTLCLSYLFFSLFPPSPLGGLASRPHPSCFLFHSTVTLIVLPGPGAQGDRQGEPNRAGEAENIVINGTREAQMSSLNAGNLFLMKNHAVTLNK